MAGDRAFRQRAGERVQQKLPIQQAKPDAVFSSLYNAEIHWEKCNAVGNSSWVFLSNMIPWSKGIAYAQSFVTTPKDVEAVLHLGIMGNYKVWVNDRLIMSEPEMRNAEVQAFAAPCQLKKGVNRILVQLDSWNRKTLVSRLQICDKKGIPITGLQNSTVYATYPDESRLPMPEAIPYFATTFFRKANWPPTLKTWSTISYWPAAMAVRLTIRPPWKRSIKHSEKAPNCSLFHYYRMAYYQVLQNSTGADEESKTILSD